MKLSVSKLFFKFWFGSVLCASVVFFVIVGFQTQNIIIGWDKTIGIYSPLFFLLCEIPALGFLWHTKEGDDLSNFRDKQVYILSLTYELFIGAMMVMFSYV